MEQAIANLNDWSPFPKPVPFLFKPVLETATPTWIALMIGNSRLHWAWFGEETLLAAWDTPHLATDAIATLMAHQLDFHCCPELVAREILPLTGKPSLPLWIASVVPEQTRVWQAYDRAQVITLDQVPLGGLYPSLGIDRALALFGAIETLGSPSLVIDAGTALTLTGADGAYQLVGGAILPGLQLQLRSLAQHTAALPYVTPQRPVSLPQRWATSTPDAIYSGVLYTVLAGLKDFIGAWQDRFPKSAIAVTGGDGALLFDYFKLAYPELAIGMTIAPNLIFDGMRAIWQRRVGSA